VATTAIVRVNDKGIASLFAPGGDASRWHTTQMRLLLRNAMNEAPQGALRIDPRGGSHAPGNLMRSHRLTGSLKGTLDGPGSPYGVWGSLYNTAPYAEYVHRGTHGPITGRRGHLWVPKSSWIYYKGRGAEDSFDGNPLKRIEQVSGQRANPWIARAAARTLGPYTR